MATITAATPEESSIPKPNKSSRHPRAAEQESVPGSRFFLSKSGTDGAGLQFDRELSSEGEARVEALKASRTYFTVQEWRPVADFTGKNPELRREAIARKETSSAQG